MVNINHSKVGVQSNKHNASIKSQTCKSKTLK